MQQEIRKYTELSDRRQDSELEGLREEVKVLEERLANATSAAKDNEGKKEKGLQKELDRIVEEWGRKVS